MAEKLHTLSTPALRPEAREIAHHVTTKHLDKTTAVVHRIFKNKQLDPTRMAAAIDFNLKTNGFVTLSRKGEKIELGTIDELIALGEIPETLHMLKIACLLPTLTDHSDVKKVAAVNNSVSVVLGSTPQDGGTPAELTNLAA